MSRLEDIEAKRVARKEALALQYAEQKAKDLEAIDALEVEHGDSNIAFREIPFTPGLPVLCAVRTPTTFEVKRFRHRTTPKHEKDKPDVHAAAEELTDVVVVYPSKETFAAMCAARPVIASQMAFVATALAAARDADEGKG